MEEMHCETDVNRPSCFWIDGGNTLSGSTSSGFPQNDLYVIIHLPKMA